MCRKGPYKAAVRSLPYKAAVRSLQVSVRSLISKYLSITVFKQCLFDRYKQQFPFRSKLPRPTLHQYVYSTCFNQYKVSSVNVPKCQYRALLVSTDDNFNALCSNYLAFCIFCKPTCQLYLCCWYCGSCTNSTSRTFLTC